MVGRSLRSTSAPRRSIRRSRTSPAVSRDSTGLSAGVPGNSRYSSSEFPPPGASCPRGRRDGLRHHEPQGLPHDRSFPPPGRVANGGRAPSRRSTGTSRHSTGLSRHSTGLSRYLTGTSRHLTDDSRYLTGFPVWESGPQFGWEPDFRLTRERSPLLPSCPPASGTRLSHCRTRRSQWQAPSRRQPAASSPSRSGPSRRGRPLGAAVAEHLHPAAPGQVLDVALDDVPPVGEEQERPVRDAAFAVAQRPVAEQSGSVMGSP